MGLKSILAGGLSSLVKAGGEIADEFIESPEERKEFALRHEALISDRLKAMGEQIIAQYQMVQEIIAAEMASGDNYTKRARPTVVYAGLAMIAVNYLLVPMTQQLFGDGTVEPYPLPVEFWAAWGGVVGLWTVGRSAEKRGINNKATTVITGNKALDNVIDIFDKAA
jgi:hypothetical protein